VAGADRGALGFACCWSIDQFSVEQLGDCLQPFSNPGSPRYALQAGDLHQNASGNTATMVCITIGIVLTLLPWAINRSVLTGAGVVAVAAGPAAAQHCGRFMAGL